MRVLILCAGQGTRLKSLTRNRPKCLVPLLNKPLLQHQLAAIECCGIREIGLVTGFAAEQLHPYAATTYHNPHFAQTNMVESLFAARDWFDGSQDLIVAYSDIVYEPRVLRTLIDTPASISTVVDVGGWLSLWEERMDEPLDDLESLKMGPDGTLREIGKKTSRLSEIEGQYVGLTKFSREVQVQTIELYLRLDRAQTYDGQPFSKMYMTSFLQSLIDAGHIVTPARTSGGWLEMDTVDDLKTYERLHQEGNLGRFWRPQA